MKKEDSKVSLIIAGICLALIVFMEIFFAGQFKYASGGLHVLNYVLLVFFIVSAVYMYINDIDAWPRWSTILLAVAIAVLVGLFGSQTAIDPQSWLPK